MTRASPPAPDSKARSSSSTSSTAYLPASSPISSLSTDQLYASSQSPTYYIPGHLSFPRQSFSASAHPPRLLAQEGQRILRSLLRPAFGRAQATCHRNHEALRDLLRLALQMLLQHRGTSKSPELRPSCTGPQDKEYDSIEEMWDVCLEEGIQMSVAWW